jgi:hypothetical protein
VDGGGWVAPDLVLLVPDAQCEVMQGVAKDGVWAVLELLEWRHVAIQPHKHRWCVEVIG